MLNMRLILFFCCAAAAFSQTKSSQTFAEMPPPAPAADARLLKAQRDYLAARLAFDAAQKELAAAQQTAAAKCARENRTLDEREATCIDKPATPAETGKPGPE
jgi:hypothetical protein